MYFSMWHGNAYFFAIIIVIQVVFICFNSIYWHEKPEILSCVEKRRSVPTEWNLMKSRFSVKIMQFFWEKWYILWLKGIFLYVWSDLKIFLIADSPFNFCQGKCSLSGSWSVLEKSYLRILGMGCIQSSSLVLDLHWTRQLLQQQWKEVHHIMGLDYLLWKTPNREIPSGDRWLRWHPMNIQHPWLKSRRVRIY